MQQSSNELLDEIEKSPNTDSVRIWGLSGAGFVIRCNEDIVYIDPWLVPPDAKRTTHRAYPIPFSPERVTRASAVISSHEHEDHCNVATIKGIVDSAGAKFIGPRSAVSKVVDDLARIFSTNFPIVQSSGTGIAGSLRTTGGDDTT
jgi:alkyl sulfatase BDS1-like metallo-beta-lactamase superfamily hydrolase